MFCTQAAAAGTVSPLPRSDYTVRAVCAAPAPRRAGCLALQLVPRTAEARAHTYPIGVTRATRATPSAAPSPAEGAFGLRPQDLHSAYQLPTSASGTQTIALVDAYNDLTAEEDLGAYAKEFRLPECTTGDGCFKKVNQNGETGNLPFPKSTSELESARKGSQAAREEAAEATGWGLEISLDIEVSHAICQNCHILLVESNEPSYEDLEKAEKSAATLGAGEISNSWAGPEAGETPELESASPFNHPGIVITAAAGDNGYLNWDAASSLEKGYVNFPASSPHVVAVGGTRLTLGAGSAWAGETVWNGDHATGGGCSVVFTAQPWQQNVSDWSAVGCGTKRAVADVAADADPYTGVAVHYTSTECEYKYEEAKVKHVVYWCPIGGTSVASPLMASVFALAGGANGVAYPAKTLYENEVKSPASLHDVTVGSNGECSKPFTETGLSGCTPAEEAAKSCASKAICLAATGYDGPTGVGTPDGIAAFTMLPNPPTVATGAASAVTQTSATLGASVNPNGGEVTECKLEYGTSTSYGFSTTCNPAPGSGSSPVAVSAAVTGLAANTTYHFRIVASNAGGTSKGNDQTFTTLPNAPTVTTGTASAVTQTSAKLGGSVNPNGGEVSECKLEYGTSTSYGSSTTCNPAPGSGSSPVAVSAAVTGLAANTTYHFRITATNAGGTSKGNDQTFTTLPNPPTVTTGTASAVTQTSAKLGASVNPNGAEVSECKLEYGTSTSYSSSTTCNPAPGSGSSPVAVSAAITGLAANTTYHFRITATNTGGTSYGSDQTFKTLPNPPTVTTGTASAVTQTSATLGASVNPNGGEASECKLEYGTSTSYGSSTSCNPAPGSGSSPVAVSAAITGLTANTAYHYRITATNAGGTSYGSDQAFKTLPNPPTVTTGTASAVTQTSATLGASVNPNGGEASECKLEYGTSTSYGSSTSCSPAPGSGSTPVPVSAAITGLAANTTYHFRITATNAGGTSYGTDQTFTTLPNAPTVTTGTASAVTQTSATLGASVNPNGGEVSECKLEYGTSTSYGSSTSCSPAPGSGSSPVPVSAAITGLAANTTYHFRITATNAGGTSQGSDQTLTTLPDPTVATGTASAVTQTTATLGGSVNPNGGAVGECELEYGTSTSYSSSTTCNPAPGSGSSAVPVTAPATGLAANTTYHFRIVASNAGGTSYGNDQTFTTLPDPPTVATGTASAVTQTTATLGGSVNPNGAEVSECELEYGTSTSYGASTTCNPAPGSGSSAVPVTAPATGLAANTAYHFRITATNAGGTSYGSDQTFTTLPNPPTVATGTASAITQTSATLGASVNPNGGEVSECKLEYGTSTSYGSSTTCNPAPGSGSSPVPITAPATGLAANTIYHFRVVASNAGGTSKGSDQTFTTLPDPTVATGTASAVTQTTATLGGSVNPNSGEVTECKLEYGTSTSYGSSTSCNPAPGSGSSPVAVSAAITGLTANTAYHYRITATNAGGTSYGSDQTFTTLPNPPTVATGTASAITQTSATLGGSVNPNGGEVSECKLEYGTSTSYGSSTTCNPAPGSGSSPVPITAPATGLAANTTYHFRVVASNAGGTSYGSDQTFTTLPNPPTVTTGTASAVTQTSATLGADVNPNGGEVTECKLEYGTNTSYGSSTTCNPAPGSGSSPVAVSASATGLTANTTYHYRITATNAGGTSKGSDQTFTTLANPPAGPEFGRCIKVTAGTGKYANTSCTTLHGKEGYEWSPGVLKRHFTTKITSGSVTLEAVKGSRVTCKTETGTGEYTGLKTVGGMVLTLTGCELLGEQCSSAGALTGEIVTQSLEGVLGIDKLGATSSQDLIGLDLFPIGRTGAVMEFSCGVTPATVQGSVIAPIKADTMLLTSALKYSAAKGKQNPESFAGEPKDILEASLNFKAFEQLGLTLATTQTNEEKVEVNAVV